MYPSGADKGQDTASRAARCRSVLVEPTCVSTRAIAPSFHPSRFGSVIGSPWWLMLDAQNCREHAPAPGPHPPAVSSTAGPFRRWIFQVSVPRGVHPIGGTAVPPVLGRFTGMGYLGEGADSPCQGEMSRRDKRGRVLDIPRPLGSSLVTFCLHRKLLARGRNIFTPRPAPQGEISHSRRRTP